MRTRSALLVVAALLALTGCSTGANAVDQTAGGDDRYVSGDGKTIVYEPSRRTAAPAVTGTTLDGKSYDLASQKGHVVVINFWAEWCPPCRAEAADLESVYQSTKDSGVEFVGVDIRDDKSKAQAFAGEKSTYPSIFDPAGRVSLDFRDVPPQTLPATLIIDKDGRIAVVIRNVVLKDKLAQLVDQVAAGS
jgi:thiol-disulfide isomerase/thioredoxin